MAGVFGSVAKVAAYAALSAGSVSFVVAASVAREMEEMMIIYDL